jgi:hypothetical protein
MGWLYSTSWGNKRELINHLCDGNGLKTIAKCVRGNVLYTVQVQYQKEDAPENRFIGVYLLASNVARGEGWGYKDMCESMHPYYFGCPLKYFDLVPTAECEEWRAKCRAEAARKAIKVKVGAIITLKQGCTPNRFRCTSVRPLRGEAEPAGGNYKIPRRYIVSVEVPQ